jgi:DNA-binding transcriptional ArsR family regulator
VPDYELAEMIRLTTAAQHRAIGNRVRWQILGLLNDRAATITQLAGALGVLKGSVSYHVRMLEQAELIRVVRTNKVRGVLERYYGRTARRYDLDTEQSSGGGGPLMLRTVADELAARGTERDEDLITITHARVTADRVADFSRRLTDLLDEFRTSAAPDSPMYGLAVALYQSPLGTAEEAP